MIAVETQTGTLRLALPKGRMEVGVLTLLSEAGIQITRSDRDYRPIVSFTDTVVKTMKPQNIIEMLSVGSRDIGFAGADWVEELDCDIVEILDTGLDPVRLVAACPDSLEGKSFRSERQLVVVSEYERIARRWIDNRGLEATFVRSFGATEVFPPEDADLIIDNAATGATLRANGLVIVDEILRSSTRLYASRRAIENADLRERIETLKILLESVIEARRRVMLEINALHDSLDSVVALLPCMREATVAPLFGDAGFAIRAAVPRENLPTLLPALKEAGGMDIVVSSVDQIIP